LIHRDGSVDQPNLISSCTSVKGNRCLFKMYS